MDNKITKKRLGSFLAYEWIITGIITAIIILIWAFVYTITAVQLTTGQLFKIYFDYNIQNYAEDYLSILPNETFSYDVLSVQYEALDSTNNVLPIRLNIQEGDMIVSDCRKYQVSESEQSSRCEDLVNGGLFIADFNRLSEECISYLKSFLRDGETDYLDYSCLDTSRIDANFENRMKNDNRYRKTEQMENGKILERERIKRLCSLEKDFEFLLDANRNKNQEIFYTQQKVTKTGLDSEKIYGLRLDKLNGGVRQASEFFKMNDNDVSTDIVLMAFDFSYYQPDLQYETISVIIETVKIYSNIALPSMA